MSDTNDSSNWSSKRRQFMKATAGSVLLFGSVGTAQAETVGTDEIGVTDKIRDAIDDGDTDKAKKILEDNDINYDHQRMVRSSESGNDDGGVSTESGFDEEKDTIDLFGYETAAPLFNAEVSWDLDPHFNVDCYQPNDTAAVTFEGARWQIDGDIWSDYYTEDTYSEPKGFYGFWNDEVAWLINDETYGNIGATLEKAQNYRGNEQNIWGHYSHTWMPPWKGSCAAAQFVPDDVSISAGALSVDNVASKWKIRKDPISL